MKKLLIPIIIAGLLLLPFMAFAQSDQAVTASPSVAQTLVPEGDFALKLVPALKLGNADTEVQAEDMLTSAGIAPKNGWIADYPMTPIIIGELQSAVEDAAAANKLSMGKEDALQALQNVTSEFGLAMAPGGSDNYAETPPQGDETVINNYYEEEGPPVVTYYPPPWDYYYLYAWVPYPFLCSGFFFPGFFILNDFDTFVVVGGFHGHHHHHMVSNHFTDPKTRTAFRVDPTTKTFGRRAELSNSGVRGFNSSESIKGANSIYGRSFSHERVFDGRTTLTGNNSGGSFSTHGRENGMNFQGNTERHFNAPNVTHERSYSSSPSSNGSSYREFHSGNKGSFSGSSGGFSRGSSGGFYGSSGGFSRGSFSGGGGGCRGRC